MEIQTDSLKFPHLREKKVFASEINIFSSGCEIIKDVYLNVVKLYRRNLSAIRKVFYTDNLLCIHQVSLESVAMDVRIFINEILMRWPLFSDELFTDHSSHLFHVISNVSFKNDSKNENGMLLHSNETNVRLEMIWIMINYRACLLSGPFHNTNFMNAFSMKKIMFWWSI